MCDDFVVRYLYFNSLFFFSLGHGDLLRREMIQSAVNAANDLWREQQGVEDAVTNLNKALSYGTPKVKNTIGDGGSTAL